jgi:hypothetical protein
MARLVAQWHIRAATGQRLTGSNLHPENLQQRRLESDRGCSEGEGEMRYFIILVLIAYCDRACDSRGYDTVALRGYLSGAIAL